MKVCSFILNCNHKNMRGHTMSKLTDKIFLMRNMDDEELKNYIKTLTDNEKDLIIYSVIKMIIRDEFDRAFQNFGYGRRVVRNCCIIKDTLIGVFKFLHICFFNLIKSNIATFNNASFFLLLIQILSFF